MTPQERAAFIKTELRKLDIRQCEIAARIGMTHAAVNRIIQGNRGSARIARAIAEAIGQPFERLFPEIAEREAIKAAFVPVPRPPRRRGIQVDAVENDRLRREVKKLMIDLDVEVRRRKNTLALHAATVSARMGKRITRQILSMALSGYRATPFNQSVLSALRDILTEQLKRSA